MNERIRKLAEQADGVFIHKLMTGAKQYTFLEKDLEKFAELIVAECGNWFNNRLVVEPDYGIEHRIERNRAVVGVMKEFKEHFGVEE
jgi:hypothetical protein